jgi:hypothetical protein
VVYPEGITQINYISASAMKRKTSDAAFLHVLCRQTKLNSKKGQKARQEIALNCSSL